MIFLSFPYLSLESKCSEQKMQIQALPPALQRPFQPPLSLGFPFKPYFLTPTKHAPWHSTNNSFVLYSRFLHAVKFRRSFATVTATTDEAVIDDSYTTNNERGFVNIGYISSVHGIQGEIRVKPATDFPRLRFSTVMIFFNLLCLWKFK